MWCPLVLNSVGYPMIQRECFHTTLSVFKVKAYSDAVENVYFYPEPSNIMLTIGKSHVTMWNIGEEIQSRSGLFTRKIPRPKIVTCATFAKTGEVLTGDSGTQQL